LSIFSFDSGRFTLNDSKSIDLNFVFLEKLSDPL
jgi:hypothetical protein